MTTTTTQNGKRYDDEDLLPFFQLQKSQVLHEAKAFNETPLDARKCCSVLTELLCLLSQGETLGSEEATTLFFGVTKLFQSDDPQLRRLVYLVIKELNQGQDQAFIVIASIEKDINGQTELFRANGLRVHSKSSMLEQRARLYRQAIVNSNDHISSSALTAGICLFKSNPDVVRRWVNECRESCRSSSPMVSFHGLNLLYKINERDRRAVIRMVSNLIKNPPESPLSKCLLIRYAFSVLGKDPPKNLLSFIKSCVKQYKSPMVMFEATKALSSIKNVDDSDILSCINVLQEYLNSPRIVIRFAAVRTLSSIVTKFPGIITPSCTVDLEHLITDSNRNIATLAITTLLKTTAEYSIERLLNSISDFMTEISDELKCVLIDSIKLVCKKYGKKKYENLAQFLSMALREEGGFNYKNKVVDCMIILMSSLERAKEVGLDNLCEFIEDSEYPQLSVRILHLIGKIGPSTQRPSRYIRFIFNRVLLELPCVRAAAVSCLTQFAVKDPLLEKDIRILLKRSFDDIDDEVRDRVTMFDLLLKYCQNDKERIKYKQLKKIKQSQDNENDIIIIEKDSTDNNDINEKEEKEEKEEKKLDKEESPELESNVSANELIGLVEVPELDFDFKSLESSLLGYLSLNNKKQEDGNEDAFKEEFDPKKIPEPVKISTKNLNDDKGYESKSNYEEKYESSNSNEINNLYNNDFDEYSEYNKLLEETSNDLPNLGKSLSISKSVLLTEPELEYSVEVIKHIYNKYIVLQCNISHQMEDKLFSDCYLEIDYDDTEIQTVQLPSLKSNENGISLIIIERDVYNEELFTTPFILGSMDCSLKFIEKDATVDNPEFEEGYEEIYSLNELEFNIIDYIIPLNELSIIDFKKKWKEIENKCNKVQRQGKLKHNNIQDSIDYVIKKVNLGSVEGSNLAKEDAPTHVANLYGKVSDNTIILMRSAFAHDNGETSYRIAIRCPNQMIAKALISNI